MEELSEVEDVAWVRVRSRTFRRREFKDETIPHARAATGRGRESHAVHGFFS
jgi:hypothetical protein